MQPHRWHWMMLLLLALDIPCPLADAGQRIDFNHDIRPLLSNSCLTCHGPDEAERVTDLRLDTATGSRIDLGGYAAIVPGDPAQSELFVRLTTEDSELRMPPKGKGSPLTEDQVAIIRRWIEQGAEYAQHWSYELPVRPELPSVDRPDWLKNEIDYFILAKLQSNGLDPSPEADRLTLARRVALDVTGLPPTWDEAMEFVNDPSPYAYEHYVDRQLAKPSFGERWARVWLDLARYADSAGYADDPPRTIWAYRDYVIRSLNDNKPFDQFTIEQIAGDLLPHPTDDQLIATAFHRNTMTNNEGGTNDEEFRNVAIVDRVNTTMAVWMGTTMACAQCHTHKYDPITQEEYFQFFAFFNSTADADKRDEAPNLDVYTDAQKQRRRKCREQIRELRQTLETSSRELIAAQNSWEQQIQQQGRFVPMVPNEATSQHRQIKVDNDGWIHARGERPNQDRYSIVYPTTPTELTGLRIEVPKYQQDSFIVSQVRATWKPDRAQPKGTRFVRIELPGNKRLLHLAEIEVFSGGRNIAVDGQIKQSSTGYGGDAKRAIDGNTHGDFFAGSVTHTDAQTSPWIEIDLKSVQPINKVVVWNRTDGGKSIRNRALGLKLLLLDQDRQSLWEGSLSAFPNDQHSFVIGDEVELPFVAAFADFQQAERPADSVLAVPLDRQQGWSVGTATARPHHLTLVLEKPFPLSDGELALELVFDSDQPRTTLDHLRLQITEDSQVTRWAQVPEAIRSIIPIPIQQRTPDQSDRIAKHYRQVAPLLDPVREKLAATQQELAAIQPVTRVPVMRELPAGHHRVTRVQVRGNYKNTGAEVEAATPTVFHPLPDGPRDRLRLARWLVADENPLTARVVANRHWEQIFGKGIVATSEEFGSQGDLPTHPELLDWLAVELRDSGWDLKHLIKLLVTTATYRQSSVVDESVRQIDPDNRFYAVGPRFRVSAEMVRDQALLVSGLLSEKMFGPPVRPPQPELGLKAAFGGATDWKPSQGDDRYRRGIYTSWRRSSPYPSMAQFDAPNREVCTVRRVRTNTPLQALVTLNDPVYVEAAQALARRMIAAGSSPDQRIEYAMRTCLIRPPTEQEAKRLVHLASKAQSRFELNPADAKKMATDPLGDLPEGADAAEYAAWTVVANVMLNLDEFLMKR